MRGTSSWYLPASFALHGGAGTTNAQDAHGEHQLSIMAVGRASSEGAHT